MEEGFREKCCWDLWGRKPGNFVLNVRECSVSGRCGMVLKGGWR